MADEIQCSFARYETKYRLTAAQQAFLERRMQAYMKKDCYGEYTICNLYYDTEDWRLIRASIEKPAYKEKLRVRSYGIPGAKDPVFAELKKKYNGIVYKRRISIEAEKADAFLSGTIPAERFGQIGRELQWFQLRNNTRPRVYIAYDRTAFAGMEDPALRITIDRNIRWRDTDVEFHCGDYGAPLLKPGEALLEIKSGGAYPLWLSSTLSEAGIFPTSFSKYGVCYCIGILGSKRKEERICV